MNFDGFGLFQLAFFLGFSVMNKYRPIAAAPTQEQFAKIGQIITDWAILDSITQMILSKMALAPWWPASALSDNLGFENRMMALRHLVEIHTIQLSYSKITQNLCDEVDKFRKALSDNRAIRNRLAHWVVHRSTDDAVFLARLLTRPAKPERLDSIEITNDELDAHIEILNGIMNCGIDLFEILPGELDPFQRK